MSFLSGSLLQVFLKKQIQNNPNYEHYVGSWVLTYLYGLFSDTVGNYVFTVEKKDRTSNKKPDIVLGNFEPENESLSYHLVVELKKEKGDRFEDALFQTVEEICYTMEESVDVFVVVVRGTKIGFFDYHNDGTNLIEDGVLHILNCISLTEGYTKGIGEDQIEYSSVITDLPAIPEDVDYLFHDHKRLRYKPASEVETKINQHKEFVYYTGAVESEEDFAIKPDIHDLGKLKKQPNLKEFKIALRTEAQQYRKRCIFDLDKPHDHKYIDAMFQYIKNNSPRGWGDPV